MQVGTGAFKGYRYVSLGYQWSRFSLDGSVAQIKSNDEWEQFNLSIKDELIHIGLKDWKVKPLNLGLAILYTSEIHYYTHNLHDYPENNYYDQNAIRLGLTYQSEICYKNISLYYDITWLDQGIIIQLNNNGYGENFLSSGIGLKYKF